MITSCIWRLDGTLTTLGECGPGSNGNEGVLYIPQSPRTEASPSDDLVSYLEHSLGVLTVCRDAIDVLNDSDASFFSFLHFIPVLWICYILTFDPAQKYYSKVIHRKEVTHSNGQ